MMNRKDFIKSIGALSAGAFLPASLLAVSAEPSFNDRYQQKQKELLETFRREQEEIYLYRPYKQAYGLYAEHIASSNLSTT